MIKRSIQTPILHRFVEHNGVIYFSGLVADDRTQSMGGQTEQICKKLDALFAEAGTDRSKMLSAMLYITDMSQKDEMNKAWTSWVAAEDLPSRATIGIAELGKDVLIEVVVIAAA
ncbi:RidA family protein [Terrihabitans sp. B22-R8]|uniref:RidA family protein n=1 Tax=Terrihabitans sp. B22-R8 TaxID=3425128 RepID=UPI00403D254F